MKKMSGRKDYLCKISKTPDEWVRMTDVRAYAVRQAQSCRYLRQLFSEIKMEALHLYNLDPIFVPLLNVHNRQYNDLASVVDVPETNRRSFYFDSMYNSAGISLVLVGNMKKEDLLKILCVQAVSYARGKDRYRLLMNHRTAENADLLPVWTKFFSDAGSNERLVLSFVHERWSENEIFDCLEMVCESEGKVMNSILAQRGI